MKEGMKLWVEEKKKVEIMFSPLFSVGDMRIY